MLRSVLPPPICMISKQASIVFKSSSLLLNSEALKEQITTPLFEFNAMYLFPFHTVTSKIGALIVCLTLINLVNVYLGCSKISLSKL